MSGTSDATPSERTKQLEESARRLREHSERVRFENRRARTFGPPAGGTLPNEEECHNGTPVAAACSRAPPEAAQAAQSEAEPQVSGNFGTTQRRLEEMRRRIAELDEINAFERERLEEEQREMERRRLAQEAFERQVQERTERELREHQEREEQEHEESKRREEALQREREERERRRREHALEEEERIKRREETKRAARSDQSQMRWDVLEQELEAQWAEQEAEERRRVEEFAASRRRRFEDWDRQLNEERRRYVAEDGFISAHRKMHGFRRDAAADEAFYAAQRQSGLPGTGPARPPGTGPGSGPKLAAIPPPAQIDTKGLGKEELSVLKELQAVRAANRDTQKLKVKELLFKWHPDKNPGNVERATRIFQFVQKHKESILGL